MSEPTSLFNSHRRVPSGGGFTSLHTVAARSGRLSDQIQAGNSASWVADNEVSSCSVCDVGFTLFLRKHHCRRCGHVVCDHCSKARLAVPPAYIQHVRVCDDCAKVLEDEDAAAAAAYALRSSAWLAPASGGWIPPAVGGAHPAAGALG